MPTKILCNSDEESELRRGPWTLEEDNLLANYISCHGEGRWNLLAKCAGLKRTGKSCRLRWLNYLKPDVKRGNLTPQEQLLILELHSKWGNRWSKIAQHLPGRTDNEIKNYWRTRVQKQARQLKIDTNSDSFLDAIRCFWMPSMLQEMDQVGSSYATPSSFSSTMDSELPSSITNHSILSTSLSPLAVTDNTDYNSTSLTSPTPTTLSPHLLQNSQLPEISEHLPSPYAFGNVFHSHPFLNCNLSMVDNSCYDMECYDPAPMSAMDFDGSFRSDLQTEVGDWSSSRDMEQTVSIWNTDDELWQFGKVE